MNLSQGPFLSCVLKGYDLDGKGTLLLLTTITTQLLNPLVSQGLGHSLSLEIRINVKANS